MERYGIVSVPVEYYQLGEYRYTNLKDAIAAGKRLQAPTGKIERGESVLEGGAR